MFRVLPLGLFHTEKVYDKNNEQYVIDPHVHCLEMFHFVPDQKVQMKIMFQYFYKTSNVFFDLGPNDLTLLWFQKVQMIIKIDYNIFLIYT